MGSRVGRGVKLELDSRGSILAINLETVPVETGTGPVYLQAAGGLARQLGTGTQLAWDMASLQVLFKAK